MLVSIPSTEGRSENLQNEDSAEVSRTQLKKTNLYRHFDKDGCLLYVGVSLSALSRLGQHEIHSHWFSSIANVTIETFETRKEALIAETNAIVKEKPKHNIQKKHKKIYVLKNEEEIDLKDETRNDLTKRVVNFYPIYHLEQAADLLGITMKLLRKIIEKKEIGHILLPPKEGLSAHGTPFKPKIAITGWQIIDYIEHLENKYAKTVSTKSA